MKQLNILLIILLFTFSAYSTELVEGHYKCSKGGDAYLYKSNSAYTIKWRQDLVSQTSGIGVTRIVFSLIARVPFDNRYPMTQTADPRDEVGRSVSVILDDYRHGLHTDGPQSFTFLGAALEGRYWSYRKRYPSGRYSRIKRVHFQWETLKLNMNELYQFSCYLISREIPESPQKISRPQFK